MKSDKATVKKRVEEVLDLRLLGATLSDIRRYASEQTPPWNVSDRQLERYIQASDQLLDSLLEKDRQKNFNRQIAQRRALYSRTVAWSHYRTALSILIDEDRLLAMYPAKKTEHTFTQGQGASPEDVDAGYVLAEAYRRQRLAGPPSTNGEHTSNGTDN